MFRKFECCIFCFFVNEHSSDVLSITPIRHHGTLARQARGQARV